MVVADAKRRADSDPVTALLNNKQRDLEVKLEKAQTDGELDAINTEINSLADKYKR